MLHYLSLFVGCQQVPNVNKCVMRIESEKSQAGFRKNVGVTAPLSSHIYSSIDSVDIDQKITVFQVLCKVLGTENTNFILEWIIA